MNEDTHNGRRRIIVRRNKSGSTTIGNDRNVSGNGGTSTASTILSGNINDSNSIAESGNETAGNGGSESEGMHRATGNESERIGSDGSGGNGERSSATGEYDELRIDFGTDSDSSGSTDGRRNRGQGTPKRTRRPRTTKTSVALEQDTEDVKNIVIAIGDASSNATGFDGFKVSEPEALTIAKPAARILQRHGAVAETIRTVADPLSLIIATASVFGPRIAGYKLYTQTGVQPQYREEDTTTTFTEQVSRVEHSTPKKTDENYTRIDPDLFNRLQQSN